ncbi:MAG: hypothetical protein Kow0092_37380 [Deferrisomatales bacterium]
MAEKGSQRAAAPPEPSQGRPGEVEDLQARAGRGLWPLVVFAALSLWAGSGFRFLPALPPGWRRALGPPPPIAWIHAAFVLYVFSALVLSLTRMARLDTPGAGFRHVGYLLAFYGFYAVAAALEDNYWAVVAGGFAILGLECYRNWLHYRDRIREAEGRSGGGSP